MVNWSGTLTSRATKLIRLNRAWGPEPGGASRHILIPLLTMIAIKFVFFEDQRLSPLPIRLSHRRCRWPSFFLGASAPCPPLAPSSPSNPYFPMSMDPCGNSSTAQFLSMVSECFEDY
jgi:hypothetical protein